MAHPLLSWRMGLLLKETRMKNRLNPKEVAKIRERIEAFELRQNGLQKISGAMVSARNIRVDSETVTANIRIRGGQGEALMFVEGAKYPMHMLIDAQAV